MTTTSSELAAMLRVDLAGEAGAQRIYAGQLAALGADDAATRALIQHMADQEDHHYATFAALCRARRVRPTVLSPVWDVAGYALGYLTAKMGTEAAMACTVAVEEVIDAHYAQQIDRLRTDYPHEAELVSTLEAFRADEQAHRDIGMEQNAANAPGYPLLKGAIALATRLAIRLSTAY